MGSLCTWMLTVVPCCPQDPCLSTLLLDKLPAPGVQPACRSDTESRCDVCTTHLHQLTREALRLLQTPASHEDPDASRGGLVAPSPRDPPGPVGLTGRQPPVGPDRRKATAWPPGPSVQVSVAPAGLGGALSTVTIQAQQCLEGVWSLSRVNSFLPPTCLVSALAMWATGSQLTSFWAPDHIWVLCSMVLAVSSQETRGYLWLACFSDRL